MKVYDNFCRADKGFAWVLTPKGKECKTSPIMDDCVPHWAWNEGYVAEEPIPGWKIDLVGYKVGYYHNGTFLSCGNPQVFPTREIAQNYADNYAKSPWFDKEIVILETTYEGVPLSEPTYYNGKPVIDEEHYFGLTAHNVGDYFSEEKVMDFMDMLPPACMRSDCMQIGEPASHRLDENGKSKATYSTFKRIADGVYEYCGDCFRGENVMKGEKPIYV